MAHELYGFADGDRVKHTDWGDTGTVKLFDLTDTERAEGCAEGEIRWDDYAVQDEFDAAAARKLTRI